MINVPNAEVATDKTYAQRTKNLENAINYAIENGKQCCYLQSHKTNPQDVSDLQGLGYETSVDSRGDLWVFWRRLNGQ